MANAAVLIDNLALNGRVNASSQELSMPATELLTPHPSDRWRSTSGSAFFVLDKGDAAPANTVILSGMTCGENSSIRVRLSLVDSSGAAGDVDDDTYAAGSVNFDTDYGTLTHLMSSAMAWRYARFDITDPDASYVEAGLVTAGTRESFTYNFAPGGGIQYVDRSRVSPVASGKTLTWTDNTFRRVDLSFEWVSTAQRYGLIQTMDRVNGRHVNVALILDTASDNLARDTIVGLVTDITPAVYAQAVLLFSKQLRLDERI